MSPTHSQAIEELAEFAVEADPWDLAAVYLYMRFGYEPQNEKVEQLATEWGAASNV